MLGVHNLAEHTGDNTEGPSAEEHGFCAEGGLHGIRGVFNLRVLVNHVNHDVGTVGELVHILTIVAGVTAFVNHESPVGELGVGTGGGDGIQTQAEEHPVVLGTATLVTEYHVLDFGICRGKGDFDSTLVLEEALGIVLVGALLKEFLVVTRNGQNSCEKNDYILFHRHCVLII